MENDQNNTRTISFIGTNKDGYSMVETVPENDGLLMTVEDVRGFGFIGKVVVKFSGEAPKDSVIEMGKRLHEILS